MGVVLVEKRVKDEVERFIKLDSKKPAMKLYRLFASDFRKGSKKSTSTIRVEIDNIDETRAAPTGKQFANANVICSKDGKKELFIPSVQFNLKEDLVFEDGFECSEEKEKLDNIQRETAKKIGLLYTGVENRVVAIGFGIIKTGKLQAHGATFDFGNSFIQAATASEKYSEAEFDVMAFIDSKLADVDADKILIPYSDINDFKGSIKDCGGNSCDGRDFIKAEASEKGNLARDGYILVGYHEGTMTPIYAVSAKITENVRNETTGESETQAITLLEPGQMLFIKSNIIRHSFGALQKVKDGVSLPGRTDFRFFKKIDDEKGFVYARLQTAPTPYLVDTEGLILVNGLK